MNPAAPHTHHAESATELLERVIRQHGTKPEAVIPILQAIQAELHYLPNELMRELCERTEINPSQLSGVATFYAQFRHRPAGKCLVRVCHGTACHVAGAEQITDSLRRHLKIAPGEDTDPTGDVTVERVACVGCCTLAPVIAVDGEELHGRLDPARAIHALETSPSRNGQKTNPYAGWQYDAEPGQLEIRLGSNSCCIANGSTAVRDAFRSAADRLKVDLRIKPVGCTGACHWLPVAELVDPQGQSRKFVSRDPRFAAPLLRLHSEPRGIWPRMRYALTDLLDWIAPPALAKSEPQPLETKHAEAHAFAAPQVQIVTEGNGTLNPLDLDEVIASGGYEALRMCVTQLTPEEVIQRVEKSGLRGRGGAGYPTGAKWRTTRAAAGDLKYVICNGDEGDPGAFMDRMVLEAYPHRIIEGLAIAAYAIGASRGVFYIRHEYQLAVQRINAALRQARERGLIGANIFGSVFSLELEVMCGAGAFVCGEETALMASVEGRRGMPRFRPPYPSESGLWGCPTSINNVETLGNLSWIFRNGPEAFAAMGTATSKGSKVFALAGCVRRGGLIEVPMGMTLWQIVHDIGGGIPNGGRLKAIQIGGPSGGCIPASLAHTPVDYEALNATGAIMGSGGLIVMDQNICMVDMARYFLEFTQKESCGRCTFCRIGTRRMLETLERICQGRGKNSDLAALEDLSHHVGMTSLCGLGKTAPNPVLTTLKYFRDEYEAHIQGRCPAGRCASLIRYEITDPCIGCTICAQECPVDAIPLTPHQQHRIADDLCVRCGICKSVCPENAIRIVTGKAGEEVAVEDLQ